MSTPTFARRENLEVIEEYYRRWVADPASVDDRWQAFFEGFELAGAGSGPAGASGDTSQTSVVRLIMNYRNIGHLQAHLDPLSEKPAPHPLLSLAEHGLSDKDLDRTFDCSAFHGLKNATLRELVDALKQTYCNTVGIEYMHIQDTATREWIKSRIEPRRMRPELNERQKRRTLMTAHYAEAFERFLHTRYQGQKRFSLEGAETLIPILDAIIEKSPSLGVKEFVIGMAHRGRLNVLANILRKPYQTIFAEFEENFLPDSIDGDGDVTVCDLASWNYFLKLYPGPAQNLKILAKSEVFPASVVVHKKGAISEEMVKKFRDGMMTAHQNPRGQKLMGTIKLDRFDNLPENYDQQLKDILKAYPAPIQERAMVEK